jgi:tRNA dimethylallyltransferase
VTLTESNSQTEWRQVALRCWYLTGATCSGKTKIAVELARRLNAEIISLDSMTVYRGMDIGTAKPSAKIREAIPHHLIDIREVNQDFSVSQFCDLSFDAIREIRCRGREVLFVGGTPLYLKCMLRGLFSGPAADWELRRQIEQDLEKLDLAELRSRLTLVDPLTAHKLHPNDKRRMIRALEVFRRTGVPISHRQTQFEESTPNSECRVFVLGRSRSELHERINERVDRMFAEGFIEEVQALKDRFGALGHSASQAVGYAEIFSLLSGEMNLETAKERVKIRTRQFARRQETWFRGLSESRWVPISGEPEIEALVESIISEGRNVVETHSGSAQ